MSYFVICPFEDGSRSVLCMSKEALEKGLENNLWHGIRFAHEFPTESNPARWDCALIIKGELVTPSPVTKKQKWHVP